MTDDKKAAVLPLPLSTNYINLLESADPTEMIAQVYAACKYPEQSRNVTCTLRTIYRLLEAARWQKTLDTWECETSAYGFRVFDLKRFTRYTAELGVTVSLEFCQKRGQFLNSNAPDSRLALLVSDMFEMFEDDNWRYEVFDEYTSLLSLIIGDCNFEHLAFNGEVAA